MTSFQSVDAGGSWSHLDAGLPSTAAVLALAIDPWAPYRLYAGTLSHGVFALDQVVDVEVTQSESVDPVVAGSGPGNLTYVVTATNLGPIPATGVEIREDLTLPAGVVVDSVVGSGGTAFDGTTWTVGTLGPGGSETLTVRLSVGASASPGDDVIASSAAVMAVHEADSDLTNDSAAVLTSIRYLVAVTKGVTGMAEVGGTVLYTIVLVNDTTAFQADNPGDELIDVLPPELRLVDARVTSGGGSLLADAASGTVTWNGSLPPGSVVTIEIEASIRSGAAGRTLVNEARIFFDPDGDGLNEATASAVATIVLPAAVPTLSSTMQALLALGLAFLGWGMLRFHSPAAC